MRRLICQTLWYVVPIPCNYPFTILLEAYNTSANARCANVLMSPCETIADLNRFHPHNHAVKSIILSTFKLLQNDPETGRIFSQPPLISFKRDKNVGNFLVRSALKTNEQPGTFKCARSRCKTCLFIVNTSKISGPKRSVKITDRFTCTSANVIYCITCTLCNKLYIGETGRRLGDRFREHLRDVEKNDKDASKPVARHFNLPNHSKKHMAICGLSLHLGTTESRKNHSRHQSLGSIQGSGKLYAGEHAP